MDNDYAPIAVFTYNRPKHTKIILDALNVSALAPNSDIYIFCDNYKDEEVKENVLKVRNIVDLFEKESRFNKTIVKKEEKNIGLASSIINGVSKLMDLYGCAIVVEDDMLASIHFLEYMNSALKYYRDDKSIWSISGYSFPMMSLSNYPHDVYMSGRGSCWGWASWKDRWQTVDWEVKDYNSYKHNWVKRHKFARWGKDLPLMLDTQMYTNHNSWAIRWCYSQFKQNMMTVYPKISYIKNIGNDGTGTHKSNSKTKYDTELEDNNTFQCKFEKIHYDEKIRKEFQEKYNQGTWLMMKTQIKWFLVRMGLFKPNH